MRDAKHDSGQVLPVVALSMVILLGFMGLALDMGYMRYMKRQVQKLADAAAIAGANELDQCTASPCSPMTTAVQAALTENGFSGSTLVTNSGSCIGSTGLTVTVNYGPKCLGSTASDPHYGNKNYVEVEVSQVEPLMFTKIFGFKSATVAARAEATLPGGGSCMFTLGTSGADITMVFALTYNSQCGWVDESSSSNAFTGALGFYDVPYFGIVGGNSCFFCFPVGGPAAETGITKPSPADPLAYLQPDLTAQAPSPSACGSGKVGGQYHGASTVVNINNTNSSSAAPAILDPGTYCGGINVQPGGFATFNSGIYTLASNGTGAGLSIDTWTTVTGNGVGFYNYGPSGGVNFLFDSVTPGAVTLTAPNSTNCGSCGSAWQGILFYQDPGDTATSVVVGSAFWNTKLTGTSYFPSANITYALDATVNYNEVVAKSVTMGGTFGSQQVVTDFNNNYSELANGNPIKSTGAVLGE